MRALPATRKNCKVRQLKAEQGQAQVSNENSTENSDTHPVKTRPFPLNAIATAAFAALTGIIGAGIGAYATLASSEKVRIESCIKRIDDREQKTREKAEALLGNIGRFIGASTTNDDSKIAEPAQKLIQSAFELTAYGPPELNVVSLHMAAIIFQGLTAKSPAQKEKAIISAGTALNGWSPSYSKLMKEFEKDRAKCLINEPADQPVRKQEAQATSSQ